MKIKFAIASVLLVATGLSCVLSALATCLPDWYIDKESRLKWGLFQLCWNGTEGGCRWHYPMKNTPGYLQASAALMVLCVALNLLSFLITACVIRREVTFVRDSVWLPIFAGGCSFVSSMLWAWPPETWGMMNTASKLGLAFWLALATSCVNICPASFSAVVLYTCKTDSSWVISPSALNQHSYSSPPTPAWGHLQVQSYPPPCYCTENVTVLDVPGPPSYIKLPPTYEDAVKIETKSSSYDIV